MAGNMPGRTAQPLHLGTSQKIHALRQPGRLPVWEARRFAPPLHNGFAFSGRCSRLLFQGFAPVWRNLDSLFISPILGQNLTKCKFRPCRDSAPHHGAPAEPGAAQTAGLTARPNCDTFHRKSLDWRSRVRLTGLCGTGSALVPETRQNGFWPGF